MPTKVCLVKAVVFQVVMIMYQCEGWTVKKAEHRRIDAFELWYWRRSLESPLDCKEIKSVNPKGNQPWIFIGKTDAEAEAPVLWPPNEKNWLIGKDPDAGKDWKQEEKGTTENEMVGWNHELNGHESVQIPGDSERQGSLVCFSPWGRNESDTSEWLHKNSLSPALPGYDLMASSTLCPPAVLNVTSHLLTRVSPSLHMPRTPNPIPALV